MRHGGGRKQEIEWHNADAGRATRTATLAGLDRIGTLTLEDYAVDVSKVEIPVTELGQRLSTKEMDGVVESFLASLRDMGGR